MMNFINDNIDFQQSDVFEALKVAKKIEYNKKVNLIKRNKNE